MIVIMEELVISIRTVIKFIYRADSMERKKSKQANKLDLIKNLVM